MLKSASRARSLVGLTVGPGGATSARPRCLPPTIRIAACADLLAQHLARHLLDRAAGEGPELEGPVGEADETCHRQAEMLEHAPHLAVLALAQGDCDPGVAALCLVEPRVDRPVAHAFDGDALRQRGE